MPITVSIATEATRDLVVDALRRAADQRTRVARGAAQHVAADKQAGGKDVRADAVKVAMWLAQAGELSVVADELAAAPNVAVVTATVGINGAAPVTAAEAAAGALGAPVPVVAGDAPPPDPSGDDGTSPEAQALAKLAGLTATDLEQEDPETGATREDEVLATTPERIEL